MNRQALETTAKMMVADGKGLLAIDESTGSCNKRFAKWGFRRLQRRGALPELPSLVHAGAA